MLYWGRENSIATAKHPDVHPIPLMTMLWALLGEADLPASPPIMRKIKEISNARHPPAELRG